MKLQAYCTVNMLNFTKYMFLRKKRRKFIVNEHHVKICEALDRVVDGETTFLIINIAPRYSKTEIVVKNFIAYGMQLNPASKFIHLSYSDELATDNSDEIRETVKSDYYQELFPYVQVSKDTDSKKKWNTTLGGGVYATSTGGQVTGFGAGEVDYDEAECELIYELMGEVDSLSDMETERFAGAIIIDDPIKPEDAISTTIRNRVNKRFESTIRNRVNSRKTPIIIIMQRLHEEDLCGYLLASEDESIEVLSLPCLYEEDGVEKALWPFKHTVDELKRIKDNDAYVFNTQYQQNPMPLEGLLLPFEHLRFDDMNDIPDSAIDYKFSITDPADMGGDKFSMPFMYVLIDGNDFSVYVMDVIHSKEGVEVNTERGLEKVSEHFIETVFIEKNGVGLAPAILMKNNIANHTQVRTFVSTISKEVRIISNYEFVKKYFVFNRNAYANDPEYREFVKDLTTYLKEGDNKHKKDAIDVLCSAAKALKAKYRDFLYGKKE